MTANPSPGPGGPGRRDRWRLGLAGAAVLLSATDTYVVVVALPAIMGGVGVGLDQLGHATPIITAFLLGYVAVLPLVGRVADLVGPGPVLAGCLAVFAAGSLLTASAHALAVVVAGRGLQGLGGGGTVPVTLALVAGRWPVERRGVPLGVVGAVQELGSVLGPLYGAAIVAVASWRAIFWINLPLTALLGLGLTVAGRREPARGPRRLDAVGAVLGSVGAAAVVVALAAPASLASSPTWGRAYTPAVAGATWGRLTTPLALGGAAVLLLFAAWEAGAGRRARALVPVRGVGAAVARADPAGALLLAVVLACVVIAFSTSDPSRQVVASSAPVLAVVAGAAAAAFAWRQRRAPEPLIGRGLLGRRPVWGALAVNLTLGGALMAVLVDVPLFARSTVDPGSEVGAALVLVRFLVAVPVGALAGGLLCRRGAPAGTVAAAGMALVVAAAAAMTTWTAGALAGGLTLGGTSLPVRLSDVELVAAGLGVGLAVAPVNAAILAAVPPGAHALASSLAVVARTVGMLAGLSALTAVGLHRFYEAQARIGSPFTLCPAHPGNCPAYVDATHRAVLSELHTIFGGAAACAAAAGVLALALLGSGRQAPAGPAGAPLTATGSGWG